MGVEGGVTLGVTRWHSAETLDDVSFISEASGSFVLFSFSHGFSFNAFLIKPSTSSYTNNLTHSFSLSDDILCTPKVERPSINKYFLNQQFKVSIYSTNSLWRVKTVHAKKNKQAFKACITTSNCEKSTENNYLFSIIPCTCVENLL